MASKRHRTVTDCDSIPTVTSPEDLIGKRIKHQSEMEDETLKWYWGTILFKQKGKKNPVFQIKYDGHKKVYHLKDIMDDYENDDLKLVPITPDDLIDKTISHLYADEQNGTDTWCFSARCFFLS